MTDRSPTSQSSKSPFDVNEHGVCDVDNALALGQVIDLLNVRRIGWSLFHDPSLHTPEFRYELRIFEGPARGIYRGRTASHAATGAQGRLTHA
jgi:hypothetical protein